MPHFNNYPEIPIIGIINSKIFYYLLSNLKEAYLGVGLFFLISGFVIPFSIEKISPYEFLFRRIIRIYPAVFVCVTIATIFLIIAQFVSSSASDISLKQLIGNALLIPEKLNVRFIEYGLWTLEIEVRFYLACFILAFFSGHRNALVLLLLPKIIFIFFSSLYAAYISFMLVGACLFNWSEGKWSGKKTCFSIIILMMINRHYLLQYYPNVDVATMIYVNHLYDLLIFFTLLLINKKLWYSAVMDKIGIASDRILICLLMGTEPASNKSR